MRRRRRRRKRGVGASFNFSAPPPPGGVAFFTVLAGFQAWPPLSWQAKPGPGSPRVALGSSACTLQGSWQTKRALESALPVRVSWILHHVTDDKGSRSQRAGYCFVVANFG